MLTNLVIKNFAIIDFLELEFNSGLTVLTGETGAGKSILLGALGLVLGDRADSNSVKEERDFSEIVAEFYISEIPEVIDWLKANELDDENQCILRRRINHDGRSRAFINNTPVTLQIIKSLGEMLIDIHGQHDHQSMMKTSAQRNLLDEYAGNSKLVKEISFIHKEYSEVKSELTQLQDAASEKNHHMDLVRFQHNELEALSLQPGEYSELDSQQKKIAHSEALTNAIHNCLQNLDYDDSRSIQSEISHQIQSLQNMLDYDESLSNVIEQLSGALIQIEESISLLKKYDAEDYNEEDSKSIELRLETILDLARKHRVDPEQLVDIHEKLAKELDNFDNSDTRIAELKSKLEQLLSTYSTRADELRKSRLKAAKELNKSISTSMDHLGMKGGRFDAFIEPLTGEPKEAGMDSIEFRVSTNNSGKLTPLTKTASGGELARISLAIQMSIAKKSRIPTLIFDEVDSGVGGGIAEIVGQHLKTLGRNNQVICITHLPQVASQATHHLRVQKHVMENSVTTEVVVLDELERIQETARMLSGIEITQESMAHAKDMIVRAQNT